MARRLTALLGHLEEDASATHLLVAHGDTLSILAALLADDLPNHRCPAPAPPPPPPPPPPNNHLCTRTCACLCIYAHPGHPYY